MVVQWLRLCTPNARRPRFDPWSGNQIPHATTMTWHSQINIFFFFKERENIQPNKEICLLKKNVKNEAVRGNCPGYAAVLGYNQGTKLLRRCFSPRSLVCGSSHSLKMAFASLSITEKGCCLLLFAFKYGASQVVLMVKNPLANEGDVRDAGSIPGLVRSPGVWKW